MSLQFQTLTGIVLSLVFCVLTTSAQLVAPGGVTTYTGRGSQRRSYGTVRDPAAGFFVAGSSLEELNGVYVRTHPQVFAGWTAGPSQHKVHLSYLNDDSGWYLALVQPEDGAEHTTHGGQTTEWLFISPPDKENGKGWRDRFGHEGNTVIPGAGTSWTHLHRAAVPGPDSPPVYEGTFEEHDGEDASVATGDEQDDLNELPFQVIYVGDEAMLHRLRNGKRWFKRQIRNALAGRDLPSLPGTPDDFAADDDGNATEEAAVLMAEEPPPDLGVPAHGAVAFAEGRFSEAASQYTDAIENLGGSSDAFCKAFETSAACTEQATACRWVQNRCAASAYGRWQEALLRQARARALRRARDFEAASADLREALRLAPRFAAGLLDQGILHMDHGLPADALQSFETLLHLNREYPGLDNWIVRASAEVNREDLALAMEAERAGSAGDKLPPGGANDEQSDDEASDSLRHLTLQHNHYTVLGLCHDFDAGELRKAFRRAGRIYHPDKLGGSNDAFKRVTDAHDTLSDPKRRIEYDNGADLERELQRDGSLGPDMRERVLRKVFPERFGFEPFGDPHESKRRMMDDLAQKAPEVPNAANIPEGTYATSCTGCSIDEAASVLTCTQCLDERAQRRSSSLVVDACDAGDVIGNHNGVLTCEPANVPDGIDHGREL